MAISSPALETPATASSGRADRNLTPIKNWSRLFCAQCLKNLWNSGYAKNRQASMFPIETVLDPSLAPRTLDEVLVYYADKLFDGSRLVTVQERLAALEERYPESASRIRACQPALMEHERFICERLKNTPERLNNCLLA